MCRSTFLVLSGLNSETLLYDKDELTCCVSYLQMYEVVRPLITLLDVERTGLQNFESLMALTNLSSISDSVR